MSTLRNKVQLIGNIGIEPKITMLESGKKVARFSMATNAYYRNAEGEKVQSTQWHAIVAWNTKAELIEQHTYKGKEIAIEGKLVSRTYTNVEGMKCYVTEIIAHEILLFGAKTETTNNSSNETNSIEIEEVKEVKTAATANKPKEVKKETSEKKQRGQTRTRRTTKRAAKKIA